MFARARVSKNKTIVFAWCFVSKRVKTCQKNVFWHSRTFEKSTKTLQILPNQVKKSQNVSKRVKKHWKDKKTQCFWRVSKRVNTCQNVSKSSRVSKRVKKVSKSVKNVSKRVNTCQNVSKNIEIINFVQCFVSKRVKNYFLTLFWHFFDTHFCLLGRRKCGPGPWAWARDRARAGPMHFFLNPGPGGRQSSKIWISNVESPMIRPPIEASWGSIFLS